MWQRKWQSLILTTHTRFCVRLKGQPCDQLWAVAYAVIPKVKLTTGGLESPLSLSSLKIQGALGWKAWPQTLEESYPQQLLRPTAGFA